VQTGSADLLSLAEFKQWETSYAERLLLPLKGGPMTLIHCHGPQLWFEEFGGWPATALNWDDRRTGPTVKEARAITALGLVAGVGHYGALRNGTPTEVVAEVGDALVQANQGLVLGPGCVIPMDCPPYLIRAARQAVER
jgi:uroporphyrinogen decarboxylase